LSRKQYDDAVARSNPNFVIFDQDQLFIDTFSGVPNQDDYKARGIMADLNSFGHIFVNYLVANDSFQGIKTSNFRQQAAALVGKMQNNQAMFEKYAPTHLKHVDSFKYRCKLWFFKFKVAISFAVKYVTVTPLKWLAKKLHIFEAWAYTISMYGTLPRTVAEVQGIIHADCNEHTDKADQNASQLLKKQSTLVAQKESPAQKARNAQIVKAINSLEANKYYADIQDKSNITLLYKVIDNDQEMFVCFDPNVDFNMITKDELIKNLQDPRKHEQELRFIKASDFLFKDKSFAKAITNDIAQKPAIQK
jgi:hypothetical protein